jgi:hypothetical protein
LICPSGGKISREIHLDEFRAADRANQPFAAVYHLDRLLALSPWQRPCLLAGRRSILTAALKKTPGEVWAVRALARQTIGDPKSVPERATLLSLVATLAKRPGASNDRLHGAVLLRAGQPRGAALVLRAAPEERGSRGPPLEELLLALAHVHQKQPDQARKYLQAAVAWMRSGTQPVQAVSLAGLSGRSPLTVLGSLSVPPGDVPPIRLDPQTANELTSLRAEVEKALVQTGLPDSEPDQPRKKPGKDVEGGRRFTGSAGAPAPVPRPGPHDGWPGE